MATLRAPSPRYRTDDPAPVIHLQEDDLAILWHVYCNRVIDAKGIYLLFPKRSEQVISRRLNRLRKGPEPYLHRLPQAVNRLRYRNGSDPQVYALASRGAQALRFFKNIDVTGRWTQKNRELRPSTIAHEVATSRFMARLWRDAFLTGGEVKFRYHQEFDSRNTHTLAAARGGLKNTLRTQITNWHGYRGEQGTAPDRIFEVVANGHRQFFFLEMDQGTETIAPGEGLLKHPSFWRQSSLLRKFIVYASAFETKAHQATFNIPVFRVLIITTSAARASAMQETCRRHLPRTRPGLFLFSESSTISDHLTSSLCIPFKDHYGRSKSIV